MEHDWIPSTLGHGNKMCRRCCATDLEAAVIGLTKCDAPPPKAANTNKQGPKSGDKMIDQNVTP